MVFKRKSKCNAPLGLPDKKFRIDSVNTQPARKVSELVKPFFFSLIGIFFAHLVVILSCQTSKIRIGGAEKSNMPTCLNPADKLDLQNVQLLEGNQSL